MLEARRSARINARACDDRMAALAGVVVLQGSCLQVELRGAAKKPRSALLASCKTLGSILISLRGLRTGRAAGALTHLFRSINNLASRVRPEPPTTVRAARPSLSHINTASRRVALRDKSPLSLAPP